MQCYNCQVQFEDINDLSYLYHDLICPQTLLQEAVENLQQDGRMSQQNQHQVENCLKKQLEKLFKNPINWNTPKFCTNNSQMEQNEQILIKNGSFIQEQQDFSQPNSFYQRSISYPNFDQQQEQINLQDILDNMKVTCDSQSNEQIIKNRSNDNKSKQAKKKFKKNSDNNQQVKDIQIKKIKQSSLIKSSVKKVEKQNVNNVVTQIENKNEIKSKKTITYFNNYQNQERNNK